MSSSESSAASPSCQTLLQSFLQVEGLPCVFFRKAESFDKRRWPDGPQVPKLQRQIQGIRNLLNRFSIALRKAGPKNFVAVDDVRLNGKLTLGENTADNGGTRIALMALRKMIAEDKTGKAGEKIDGYTPEQRFFLGFGRVWCDKRRPEWDRMLATVDQHSPGKYRINGVLQNMPEFQRAFQCKAGDAMVRPPAQQCRLW